MTREVMKQALEALDCIYSPLHVREINKVGAAITALRQALEQADEPVKWQDTRKTWIDVPLENVLKEKREWVSESTCSETLRFQGKPYPRTCKKCGLGPCIGKPVTQREWVGLTDEEIDQGLLRSDYALQTAHAWRAGVVFAMTQLKEKNK